MWRVAPTVLRYLGTRIEAHEYCRRRAHESAGIAGLVSLIRDAMPSEVTLHALRGPRNLDEAFHFPPEKPTKKQLLKQLEVLAKKVWPLPKEHVEEYGDDLEAGIYLNEVRIQNPYEEDSVGASLTHKDTRLAAFAMKAALLVLAGDFTIEAAAALIQELPEKKAKRK